MQSNAFTGQIYMDFPPPFFFLFGFVWFGFVHGCVFFNGCVKLKAPLFKLVVQKGFLMVFCSGIWSKLYWFESSCWTLFEVDRYLETLFYAMQCC